MTKERLMEICAEHTAWIWDNQKGKRADLSGENLCCMDLNGADLRGAILRGADLRYANLSAVDFRYADLHGANLKDANLAHANLSGADLSEANFEGAELFAAKMKKANMKKANLEFSNLNGTNLSGADMNQAKLNHAELVDADLRQACGLISAIDFVEKNFEATADGYIGYTNIGLIVPKAQRAALKPGMVLNENVNFDRCSIGGSGIWTAPTEPENRGADCWKVLIRWRWLCGVCPPYENDLHKNIKCERVELIKKLETGGTNEKEEEKPEAGDNPGDADDVPASV